MREGEEHQQDIRLELTLSASGVTGLGPEAALTQRRHRYPGEPYAFLNPGARHLGTRDLGTLEPWNPGTDKVHSR